MKRYKKHIIIVGSARSGTSWLSETIAKQHRYRLLFEPDHEFQTPKGSLLCDKWIQDKNGFSEGYAYLKKVFANRVDSDWIAQNSNRRWKRHLWPFIPKQFVIKFVRANLLAPFMNSEFNIPVLHLIRDPFKVIASQKRVDFPWLYNMAHFTERPKLVDLVKKEYDFDFNALPSFSSIQLLALRWCLENAIPLHHAQLSPSYKIVRYEELKEDIGLFRSICDEFGLVPVDNLTDIYGKPSSKTHPNSSIRGKESAVGLNDLERQEIAELLHIFKLSHFTEDYL